MHILRFRNYTSFKSTKNVKAYSTIGSLEEYFSRSLSQKILQQNFVKSSVSLIEPFGFNATNTIPFVATCRDELACSIFSVIDDQWRSENNEHGVSFSVSSLGGMILLGKRGMASAISHAPTTGGKKRFVFYAFSHMGIHSSGEVGRIRRMGMSEDSSVCGAILSLLGEMKQGHINIELDPLDIEYSHLKHSLLSNIKYGVIPTASQITHIAYETIVEDLEKLLSETIVNHKTYNNGPVDYSVFTGIQIHMPDLQTYIWPGKCYVSIDGVQKNLYF